MLFPMKKTSFLQYWLEKSRNSKKKNLCIFSSSGGGKPHPYGTHISSTDAKFKNRLDDVISIDISYQPLAHMPHYAQRSLLMPYASICIFVT